MKKNVKFYRCPICGNVIGLIDGDPEHLSCCGRAMEQMQPNTADAATEKHVPECQKVGDKILVRVGEVEHPMEEDHYIMWIAQVTEHQTTRVRLHPGQATETRFPYIPGSVLYEYCNKHGLWKKEVE